MEEADLDKDNKLGESEFEHMLKKSPDFMELVLDFKYLFTYCNI